MSTSWIHPSLVGHAYWKRPAQRPVRVEILFGYTPDPHVREDETRTMAQARMFILHIVNQPAIQLVYSKDEIDRVFNTEVLSKHAQGRYFSKDLDPKTTMATLESWADLLNDKIGTPVGDLLYLGDVLAGKHRNDQNIFNETLHDLQRSLRDAKIIEAWIFHHRDFMRGIITK